MAEKDRIDGLVEVIKIARASFDQRRSYEWKFSLSLWTALVLLIGLAIRAESSLSFGPHASATLVFLAVSIVVLHIFFHRMVYRSNAIDLRRAELFEAHLDRVLGVKCFEDGVDHYQNEAQEALNKKRNGCFGGGQWVIWVHSVSTIILVVLAGIILFHLY